MSGDTVITVIGNPSPLIQSSDSPAQAQPSPTSPWPPRRGSSIERPTNGKTEKPCSCAATSDVSPETSQSLSPGDYGSSSPAGSSNARSRPRMARSAQSSSWRSTRLGRPCNYATATVNRAAKSETTTSRPAAAGHHQDDP